MVGCQRLERLRYVLLHLLRVMNAVVPHKVCCHGFLLFRMAAMRMRPWSEPPNAYAQWRGQSYHPPLTEPPSHNTPLSPRPLQWVVRRAYRQIHAMVGKLCTDEETLG